MIDVSPQKQQVFLGSLHGERVTEGNLVSPKEAGLRYHPDKLSELAVTSGAGNRKESRCGERGKDAKVKGKGGIRGP